LVVELIYHRNLEFQGSYVGSRNCQNHI
jgi:hypothetical protein